MKFLKTLALFLSLMFSVSVVNAETKIAFVDIALVMNEAPEAKAAQKKLEQEFAPRNAKIKSSAEKLKKQKDKLKKEKDVLSKAQVDALIKKIAKLERSIERDATEAREDFQIRRNEELGKIEKRLKTIILDIAKKGGYDLVLTNNNVTWAKPNSSIDITKKVIKAMK